MTSILNDTKCRRIVSTKTESAFLKAVKYCAVAEHAKISLFPKNDFHKLGCWVV